MASKKLNQSKYSDMPYETSELSASKPHERSLRQPRSPLWRLRVWQLLILVGFSAIAGRLYYLQILKGKELTRRAIIQRQQNNLLIHRGAITDRHGLPLAIDTTRYDVYVHPGLLTVNIEEASEVFSRITHQEKEKVRKLFLSGNPVITLARYLGREEIDELQALSWTAIDIVPRSFRHYPEGQLAAHILGYVNLDTHGQGGVEQAAEVSLKNTGNINKPQLDGRGHLILEPTTGSSADIAPPMGRHIELTIDNYLQHLAEKELSAMCNHSHALRGTTILMEPQTGEILAWANWPGYDPNEYSKYPFETTKNWAMVDVFQPGSTFKILTVASALDLGVIRPDSTFVDNGSLAVGNRVIHNHEPGGHGTLDLLHLFIHSSNVAAGQVGLLMTAQQFHEKLSKFGLGGTTGIELSGESAGLLLPPKKWTPIDRATTGFGQGAIAVTPLQLIAAVGAVANNGELVRPHLVRRVYDPRTGVTERWTETHKAQVISPQTAHIVSSLLAANIAQGTQLAGKIPGYRVSGKTGTAQKAAVGGRGYLVGQTIASFIGFLPADNPQLLCLVVIDSPQTDGRWGNTIAGPVFNAICVEAARYLGVPPSEQIDLDNEKNRKKFFLPPSVKYAKEVPAKEAHNKELKVD